MVMVWLGALCVVAGMVLMAGPAIWKGRLSGSRLRPVNEPTLEPRKPAGGFGLHSNWPGVGLTGLGIVLLLAAAML